MVIMMENNKLEKINNKDKYIGFKLIEAEPAYKITTDYGMGGSETKIVTELPLSTTQDPKTAEFGYKVIYPDGYTSWSPKEIFEAAYLKVNSNEKLSSGISIDQSMVDAFIKEVHVQTIGTKTTLVRVELVNGYEIVESSSCVDETNYDESMGKEICLEKIKNKVWELLGFLLQTAYKGIK